MHTIEKLCKNNSLYFRIIVKQFTKYILRIVTLLINIIRITQLKVQV